MINRVVLVGYLSKEPEVLKANNGVTVTKFRLACNRRKSKDQEQQTDFISCVSFGYSAEFIGTYGKKGDLIGVDGHIQTGSYTNKQNQTVYTTDVVCDEVKILKSKERTEQPKTSEFAKRNGRDLEIENTLFNQGGNTDSNFDINSEDLPF